MMNRLPLPPTRHPVASPAIVESQQLTVLASSVPRCPPPPRVRATAPDAMLSEVRARPAPRHGQGRLLS